MLRLCDAHLLLIIEVRRLCEPAQEVNHCATYTH